MISLEKKIKLYYGPDMILNEKWMGLVANICFEVWCPLKLNYG